VKGAADLFLSTQSQCATFEANRRFAGLGLVMHVNEDATEMLVSPAVVAFPHSRFSETRVLGEPLQCYC
jgi:hypothetical protein